MLEANDEWVELTQTESVYRNEINSIIWVRRQKNGDVQIKDDESVLGEFSPAEWLDLVTAAQEGVLDL